MARLAGRVVEAETRAPVADLVVRAALLERGGGGEARGTVWLGSAATDRAGRFAITATLPDEQPTARVAIAVAAPDTLVSGPGGDEPEGADTSVGTALDSSDFLLVTKPRVVTADASEEFRIVIDAARLEAAGVLPPDASSAGTRYSERARRVVEEAARTERDVAEAVSARVADDRILERAFASDFLPRFLRGITASSGAVRTDDYEFVVGPDAELEPLKLARRAITRGITLIQNEGQPGADRDRAGRRRTRYFFDDAQLQELDTATIGGAVPAGEFGEITEDSLVLHPGPRREARCLRPAAGGQPRGGVVRRLPPGDPGREARPDHPCRPGV